MKLSCSCNMTVYMYNRGGEIYFVQDFHGFAHLIPGSPKKMTVNVSVNFIPLHYKSLGLVIS